MCPPAGAAPSASDDQWPVVEAPSGFMLFLAKQRAEGWTEADVQECLSGASQMAQAHIKIPLLGSGKVRLSVSDWGSIRPRQRSGRLRRSQ